jgi:hypothetical protein
MPVDRPKMFWIKLCLSVLGRLYRWLICQARFVPLAK